MRVFAAIMMVALTIGLSSSLFAQSSYTPTYGTVEDYDDLTSDQKALVGLLSSRQGPRGSTVSESKIDGDFDSGTVIDESFSFVLANGDTSYVMSIEFDGIRLNRMWEEAQSIQYCDTCGSGSGFGRGITPEADGGDTTLDMGLLISMAKDGASEKEMVDIMSNMPNDGTPTPIQTLKLIAKDFINEYSTED